MSMTYGADMGTSKRLGSAAFATAQGHQGPAILAHFKTGQIAQSPRQVNGALGATGDVRAPRAAHSLPDMFELLQRR